MRKPSFAASSQIESISVWEDFLLKRENVKRIFRTLASGKRVLPASNSKLHEQELKAEKRAPIIFWFWLQFVKTCAELACAEQRRSIEAFVQFVANTRNYPAGIIGRDYSIKKSLPNHEG